MGGSADRDLLAHLLLGQTEMLLHEARHEGEALGIFEGDDGNVYGLLDRFAVAPLLLAVGFEDLELVTDHRDGTEDVDDVGGARAGSERALLAATADHERWMGLLYEAR